MYYNKKNKNKTKRNLKIAIIVLLVLAVLAAAAYFGYPQLQKYLYPLKYEEEILNETANFDLSSALIAAMIYTESGFDEDSESAAGAVGLMQIMPDSGEWIAGKLGIEFKDSMLKDPDTNIKLGCWYVSYLLDRFSDTETMLAAYNAGPNKVADWLSDVSYSSDGKTLNSIPYGETEKYVEKVQGAYDVYKKIYDLS
ncbi:MAG: lytic transglycosylase domain-containing protein [Eubacteriales bacterium]